MLKVMPVLLWLLISSVAFGQKVGSREAYQVMRDIEIRAQKSESEWNEATKLSKVKPKDIKYKDAKQDFTPQSLKENEVGMIQGWTFSVYKIIDPNNVVLELKAESSKLFWIEGIPTKSITTDEVVAVVDPVKIGQPKRYLSEMITFATAIPLEEYDAIIAKKKRDERALKCEDFKKKSGESFFAEFVDYRKAKAIFEDVDGKGLEIPIAEFDEASAARIRELFKKKPKAK
jgi:hypothetical protein